MNSLKPLHDCVREILHLYIGVIVGMTTGTHNIINPKLSNRFIINNWDTLNKKKYNKNLVGLIAFTK